jgi:hypothetical protein
MLYRSGWGFFYFNTMKIIIKKKRRFCLRCYGDDVYFIMVKGRVQIRCSKCNSYIKWASPEERIGKEILNEKKPKKLF